MRLHHRQAMMAMGTLNDGAMSKMVYHQTSAGFAATASAFVTESLGLIMPWLMVMAALIVGDLVAGIAKAVKMGEKVRFSRAVRDTLAKSCTYFAWVVMVCWVQVASGGDTNYAEWACMIVVVIEAASIISNILKWHGYNLDFGKLVAILLAKKLDGDAHDFEGVVTQDKPKRPRPGRRPTMYGGRGNGGGGETTAYGKGMGAAKDGCDTDDSEER